MIEVEGRLPATSQDVLTARFGVTDEQYVKTMHLSLMRRRDFSETDTAEREPVALINEEFARRFLAGADPVGARIHLGQPVGRTVSAPPNPIAPGYVTVVGVVGNFRNNGVASPPEPQLIALFRQQPSVNFGFKDLVVRTAQDPRALTSELRLNLQALDPDLPLAEVQTVEEYISKQTSDQRFVTSLLSLFAGLGLILAIVGIYGVVSYVVTQRTKELGVRLAFGASQTQLLWLVIRYD